MLLLALGFEPITIWLAFSSQGITFPTWTCVSICLHSPNGSRILGALAGLTKATTVGTTVFKDQRVPGSEPSSSWCWWSRSSWDLLWVGKTAWSALRTTRWCGAVSRPPENRLSAARSAPGVHKGDVWRKKLSPESNQDHKKSDMTDFDWMILVQSSLHFVFARCFGSATPRLP